MKCICFLNLISGKNSFSEHISICIMTSVLHLGDWVIGVCALSCCETGTEDHFWHVYCDSHTLNGLPHGLLRTHCDVQPPRGSSLKETDILPHVHRDRYQTMREKVTH